MRGRHWRIVNPDKAPITRGARSFCDAERIATAKSRKNA
jgi:hypothetical protein